MAFNVQGAKAAGYTDEEIEQYLRQQVETTPQPKQDEQGFLSKAANFVGAGRIADVVGQGVNLAGATKDFVEYKTAGTDEERKKQALEYKARMDKVKKSQEGYGFTDKGFNPKKYAEGTTKGAVQAASFVVPFGKGVNVVTKAILPGATVGGLQALSQDDVSAGGVVGGVVGGAAGSGLLHGAGKVVGKVAQGAKTRMMNSVFKEPINATKKAIQGGKTLGEEALDLKVMGKNATSIYQKAEAKMEGIEDEISTAIAGSKRIIPLADIKKTVQPLIEKYSKVGNTNAVKAITDRLVALEQYHGKSIPVQVAQEIKRTLYQEIKDAGYQKIASPEVEGLKGVARALKEGIASKVNTADINKLNKDLSVYGRISKSMLDKMTREERNNILGLTDSIIGAGGLATGAGIPAMAAIGVKKALGSTAGKTIIANTLDKQVPQAVKNVASEVGGQMFSRLGGKIGEEIGSPNIPVTQEGDNANNSYQDPNHSNIIQQGLGDVNSLVDTTSQSQGLGPVEDLVTIVNSQTGEKKTLPRAEAQAMVEGRSADQSGIPSVEQLQQAYVRAFQAGDTKAMSQIKTAMDFLHPEGKQTSLSDKAIENIKDLEGGLTGIQSIRSSIEQEGAQTGPFAGLRAINPYDTDAQSLQAEIDRVRQKVGKALEGGVLRKEDEEKYKKILATMRNTEEVNLNKLTQLEMALKEDLQRYIQLQSAYGKGASQNTTFQTDSLPNLEVGF